jgi:hypothetical protein
MPWSQTDVMKERVKFVLEWERRWKETHGGRVDVAELCRMFGVSRPTLAQRRATCPKKRPRVLTNPSPIEISDHRDRTEGIRPHGQGTVRETHERLITSNDRRRSPARKRAAGGQGLAFTVTVVARVVRSAPPRLSKEAFR